MGAQEVGGTYDSSSGRGGSDGGGGGGDDDERDEREDDESDASQRAEEEEAEKEARLRLAAVELSSPAVIQRVAEKLKGYRLPVDRVEELRETLKGFLGTKNYHNYTNHKKADDPSCKRYARKRTARCCAQCSTGDTWGDPVLLDVGYWRFVLA